MTTPLAILSAFLPLAMACAMVPSRLRRFVAAASPLAPLPALGLAATAQSGFDVALPDVLLGLQLGLDETRRPVLAVTAVLWIAAAVYGRGYLAGARGRERYDAFFLVTMGGNLGAIVALDVPGFYLFFSLMTLASYILVVFDRSERAYAAGRVYIVLSIVGETALLLGFMGACAAANSFDVADIAPALAQADDARLSIFLLFVGFAIKAGQLPLHVWLPLAHPAAPTPASAVLSGAMIKVGVLGMILFLPLGEAQSPGFSALLVGTGLATAFYGVACGLPQTNPKTVLAYSSLSQMGLLVAALGVALAAPDAAPVVVAAALVYVVHHGLAKGALFLSVGVVQRARAGRLAALVVAGLCAVSIAGAPLTAGTLAKHMLKEAAGAGEPATEALALVGLLSWSAVATALLMLRFATALADERDDAPAGAGALLWAPFVVLATASQVAPWLMVLGEHGETAAWAVTPYGLWDGAWPVALAILAGSAAVWIGRTGGYRLPPIPEGDWLVPARRLGRTGAARLAGLGPVIEGGRSALPRVPSGLSLPRSLAWIEGAARGQWGGGVVAVAIAVSVAVAIFS